MTNLNRLRRVELSQQTNDFQQLVAMIQRALAPKGAKVTESFLADASGRPESREIDILIEASVGPYRIKIAVEAKDEGRKMDSPKFESILGKYKVEGGPKVDKIVVITHQGFYEPVIDRAKLLGIDLYTLKQATEADWAATYPQHLNLRLPPHLCGIEVVPPIAQELMLDLIKEGKVTCCHGHDHGTLPQFISTFLSSTVLKDRPSLFAELEQVANINSGQAGATFSVTPNHRHTIRFREKEYPLTALKFVLHLVDAVGSVTYNTCQLQTPDGDARELPLAESIVAGKRIRFLLPDGPKSPTIVLRIDSV
jgi:hypothetical protein